jgi:tetratricopeptide (TPR) repeat protein
MEQLKRGEREKAYKLFMEASRKDTLNSLANWAASNCAGNQNEAFVNAKDAWSRGLKRPDVLFRISDLMLHSSLPEKSRYMLSLYKELPDSSKTPLLLGDIFFKCEQYDSCLARWEPLYAATPSGPLCFRIAMAYNSRHNMPKAEQVLFEGKRNKILNVQGYLMLATLYAVNFRFNAVDSLFNEIPVNDIDKEAISMEKADFLLAQERYAEAEKILDKFKTSAGSNEKEQIGLKARLGLCLLYFMQKQPEKIKSLVNDISQSAPFQKAEQTFYTSAASLQTDSISAKSLEELEVVRKALRPNPNINLICGRINMLTGAFEKAIGYLENLPDIYKRSPRVMIEKSKIFHLKNDDDKSLALISDLHSHGLFSKPSLELFRDITFKRNMLEKSMAAQKVLESRYSNDAGVLWSKGLLAIKNSKWDSALAVFSLLTQKFPKEEKFESARLSVFLLKKDFNRAIAECEQSKYPQSITAPLKARAYIALGKKDLATASYEKALTEKKTPELLMEYGIFLIESGNPDKAIPIYEELVTINKNNAKINKLELASYFNNLAWAMVQSNTPQKNLMWAAEKAYSLAPDNLNIVDTYCEALILSNKFEECIKTLEKNPNTKKEPRLLFHLGTAFEKNNNINFAYRTFGQALACPDSSAKLPLNFKRDELKAHIEQLKGK